MLGVADAEMVVVVAAGAGCITVEAEIGAADDVADIRAFFTVEDILSVLITKVRAVL